MRSRRWRVLGPGNLLGVLRAELKKATRDVVIIGPWIDDYFASAVVEVCPRAVALRVLTRPVRTAEDAFATHASAAQERLLSRESTAVRTNERLHAKLLVIDDATVFCGSANWYRYSLEDGLELVLQGPLEDVPGVLDEVAGLWDRGEPVAVAAGAGDRHHTTRRAQPPTGAVAGVAGGYRQEVLDPVAAAALASVSGGFVLGRVRRGRRQ